jgi:hypothetical protein
MAMIMRAYVWLVGATGPPQRPFLGEDVARREFGRAGKGQVFAHGVGRRRRCKPWTGQTARGIGDPVWDAAKSTLLRQIFSDRAYQGIKLDVAG